MTANEAIAKVISVMEKEIGYLEKKTNSNLYDKTANAGSNNYTKYWLKCPKYQGLAWCAMFVHWCFAEAFGDEMAKKLLKTEKMTGGCYIDPDELGFKTSNKTPLYGSVVLFWNGKRFSHTGFVVGVTSTTITTIEGNTSSENKVVPNGGAVRKKTYSRSALNSGNKYFMPDYSLVTGFAESDYQKEEIISTKVDQEHVEIEKVFKMSDLKTLKKGSKGTDVKAMQILLKGYSFSVGKCGCDGDFGPATEMAVKSFQKSKDIIANGECGPETWAKLLGV